MKINIFWGIFSIVIGMLIILFPWLVAWIIGSGLVLGGIVRLVAAKK